MINTKTAEARDRIALVQDELLRQRSYDLLQRIDTYLESKDSSDLMIAAAESDEGAIGVELMYSERRLSFHVDPDPKKSSWAYVSKRMYENKCGDLVLASVEDLISDLIENHRQYQSEKHK